jgi:predicted peroxiredoxin
LRKYLIAVIAALAALAMATVAVAQNSDVTATTTVSPTKSGTKKKPKSIKITTFVQNNVPNTTAAKIEIDFPKTVKISGKGLTACKLSAIQANGPTACPSKSKAGTGLSHAVVGPDRIPLNFDVTAFVGGKNLVIFYIKQQGGTVSKALSGKISKGSGGFAQKLVITIPPDLQQPAPGLYAALTDLKSTLQLKKGKNALVTSVGCKNKKHKFGAKLTFAPNPAQPPKPSATGTSTATCKK